MVGCLVVMMECKELNCNKDCAVGGSNRSGGGAGFVDRSKVKILLCDNDSKSSQEVFTLLLRCSYQGMFSFYCYRFCFFPIINMSSIIRLWNFFLVQYKWICEFCFYSHFSEIS